MVERRQFCNWLGSQRPAVTASRICLLRLDDAPARRIPHHCRTMLRLAMIVALLLSAFRWFARCPRWVYIAGVCARCSALALGWLVVACAVAGCPENAPGTRPSPDLSVTFRIEPIHAVASAPQTLTYRVIVDAKGVLNAGVEFDTANVPAPLTATVNPARIAETARETQLVVEVPAGTRPGTYDFTLRARLTGSGPGGPDWTSINVFVEVASNESGFSVTCMAELAVPAGSTRTLTCRTIRDRDFNAIIDLSFTNRPGYITIVPETASVGPDVGGFVFDVRRSPGTTPPAFFDLVVRGQSGGLIRHSTTRLHFP